MSGIINSAGSRSGVIGTTELDYEEGTFELTGHGITLTSTSGRYTKIGNFVFINFFVQMPSTVNTDSLYFTGLPFVNLYFPTGQSYTGGLAEGYGTSSTYNGKLHGYVQDSTIQMMSEGSGLNNSNFSSSSVRGNFSYHTAS
jgi:hypothetical protein